jgi:SPX domain protein involved in polyphosphate accumulation
MSGDRPDTLRYERKFVVGPARGSQSAVAMLLRVQPAMFSQVYAERAVNSIYFDTIDRRHYAESEAGLSARTKVRVRWYGPLGTVVEGAHVEFKIKRNALGRKDRYPIADTCMDELFDTARLSALLDRSGMTPAMRGAITSLRPTLLNRYRRRYYLSACRRFRVTVDTELEYFRVDATGVPSPSRNLDPVNTVIELKYAVEDDSAARDVACRFPFRVERNSKYLVGLQRLTG